MSLFIAGTDTGIGKTLVSSLLAHHFDLHYWKPIQSGTQTLTDSQWVAQFLKPSQIIPETYVLTQPLSPHLSAKYDGVQIRLLKLLNHEKKFKKNTKPWIIEGAGGLHVPLNFTTLQIDWIKKLQYPCLLVARSILGTLNHTLLSLEALYQRGIALQGVILVGPPNPENRMAIEHYGKRFIEAKRRKSSLPLVLAEIPWLKGLSTDCLSDQKMRNHIQTLGLQLKKSLTQKGIHLC